jgi:histidinol-phosphate/aromatic aminotransferase/cobyric acid decarboxylase-like protein
LTLQNLPPDAVRIIANENTMGPCPAARTAIAKGLTPQRRQVVSEIREANMLMANVRRPGEAAGAAMLREKVAIGRPLPSQTHHVRVTIGLRREM